MYGSSNSVAYNMSLYNKNNDDNKKINNNS